MVLKASKTQILSSKSIKSFSMVCTATMYATILSSYVLTEMKKGISPIQACFKTEYSVKGRIPAGQMVLMSYLFGWCLYGGWHDIMLYKFMKNKKKIDQNNPIGNNTELIPLKSCNDKDDPGVPLRATIISVVSSILIIVSFIQSNLDFSYTLRHPPLCN